MDRREFFGCIGKVLMAGAVTVIAPEVLEVPKPDDLVEIRADGSVHPYWGKPDFALAC